MIKVEVIEKFSLKDFKKVKNVKRKSVDVQGTFFIGDTFECDEEMAKYLTGENALKKVVVKVLEVEPIKEAIYEEKEVNEVKEVKSTKKNKKKK